MTPAMDETGDGIVEEQHAPEPSALHDWTAEPWYSDVGYVSAGPSRVAIMNPASDMAPARKKANARRAVACVNACKGWPTEELEAFDPAADTSFSSALNQEAVRRIALEAELANLHNAVTERDALIIELARTARMLGLWNDADDDSTWHFTGCPASGHQEKLAECLPVCTALREIIAKARGEVKT